MRIFFLSLVLILVSIGAYVLTNIEVEKSVPPTIEIVVGLENYSSGYDVSEDIIALVVKKQKLWGEDATIVLHLDKSIPIERVHESINLLKNGGFRKVSFGVASKKI